MAKDLKLGDIVKFKKGDGWDKFHKGNFEVGWVGSPTQIKLQTIRGKERLPVNFNSSSLVVVRRGDSYKRLKARGKL